VVDDDGTELGETKTLMRAFDFLVRGLVFRMGLQSPILFRHVTPGWHDKPQDDLASVRAEAAALIAHEWMPAVAEGGRQRSESLAERKA
jgi:hypothetical protein